MPSTGSWAVAYSGSVQRAEGTMSYRFERPSGLDYEAGQFFFISIADDDGSTLEHHFSFSSSPTEPFIEYTTRVSASDFKRAQAAMAPGTVVTIEGPRGTFVLPGDADRVLYLCGGVGITPARSTIRWAVDTAAGLDIALVYANRDQGTIAFGDELDRAAAEARSTPALRVVHVLEKPMSGWDGLTGYVDADLVREEVPDWAERLIMVCGPPPMVEAMRRMLDEDLEPPADQIRYERFSGYR